MITPVPRSLAGRTALAMVAVLVIVQAAGLTIHAMDRVELQRLADGRDLGTRTVALYRAIVAQPGEAWPAIVHDAEPIPGVRTAIEPTFRSDLGPASPEVQRLIRPYLGFGAVPQPLRPKNIPIRGAYEPGRLLQIGLQLPDDRWLTLVVNSPELRPWSSVRFIIAFAIMTATAALIATWSVRRLTDPVRVLANAAERLGRDVNAPPLPEDGPTEVAAAAAAFNTMAARIRRFVADRTFLLTAIGHDLRTPITRLKLRAEWMDDDEQRRKMLADLDELEAMVAATLAFGRDAAQSEPTTRLDLPALLRTILDEAADARPDVRPGAGAHAQPGSNARLTYAGPETLPITARPIALKRAIANLVANALAYGDAARVQLAAPVAGQVTIHIQDEGPGIPLQDIDRVFEPFQRLEPSRNRETGGTGLGLPIARNILRAHGGDVTLANHAPGLRATITLPA